MRLMMTRRSIRVILGAVLGLTPSVAMAGGKMPQMDFSNPLTGEQVVWMAIIMIGLYFILSRWALPQIGQVIENRQNRILSDLDTARAAKARAEHAGAELNLAIRNAREASQSAIAEAVNAAKAKAREQSAALTAELDAQIARAEAEIDISRQQAVAALPPVAEEVTASLLQRLTGTSADRARIERTIAAILA
ncbi:MAG: F0F1 ATP synthase subunit B [Acidiphilium sp.]|nr:F0F1 ATP synthase subunit B [Acidiphilium sp.]